MKMYNSNKDKVERLPKVIKTSEGGIFTRNLSELELISNGYYPIQYNDAPDSRYYITVQSRALLNNVYVVSYTSTDKPVAELKTNWIAQTKVTANAKLITSDWMVVRKAETGEAIPSAITTYRSAVRTATGTIETAINACNDLDDFKALFVVPMDSDNNPTGNAPIYDFPDEV